MSLICFRTPARIIVVGSSGCGKSFLVTELIRRRREFFDRDFDKIFYFSKFESSVPPALKTERIVTFQQGLPTDEQMENKDIYEHHLYILDDNMEAMFGSDVVSRLFTQGRHRRCSVILISQNLFPRSSKSRNISLNASHLIVFRNCRDSSSIANLARQVFPNAYQSFVELFNQAICKPFDHLVFCFDQTTNNLLRLRENILHQPIVIFARDDDIEKATTKHTSETSKISNFAFEL